MCIRDRAKAKQWLSVDCRANVLNNTICRYSLLYISNIRILLKCFFYSHCCVCACKNVTVVSWTFQMSAGGPRTNHQVHKFVLKLTRLNYSASKYIVSHGIGIEFPGLFFSVAKNILKKFAIFLSNCPHFLYVSTVETRFNKLLRQQQIVC